MGYGTKIRGRLTINPPLPWSAVKDSRFLPDEMLPSNSRGNCDLELIIAELPQGDAFLRVATGLRDRFGGESFSRHHLEERLQSFVDEHPGQYFGGRLDLEGEEAEDVSRLKVIDGKVKRFEPKLTWPEESE